ncbi:MAG TPA: helix-turn-helix domain-containing protein [Rhizomicrobium sp.]|nr:helix-turn-helix domain-containing protein [Rhizomicrobium sp.]
MKRIGFVGFDGVSAMDLFGPLDVFDTANDAAGDLDQPYELLMLSLTGRPFTLEQGLSVSATGAIADAPPLDTIVIPGGAGAREPETARPIAEWLKRDAHRARRIASVGLGIYILAETGLLEGREATTHWRFVEDVARRFPGIRLTAGARYVRDGALCTSAGATAGVDAALSFVEEDLGSAVALRVARDLMVCLKRSGGQIPLPEPLQYQTHVPDDFRDLADWMLQNLRADLSLEALGERMRLSPRQFSRRFKAAFGTSPGEYVEKLRLDEARHRLVSGNQSVESIGASVGYASGDAFRKAFERRFGIAPTTYRASFSPGRAARPVVGD